MRDFVPPPSTSTHLLEAILVDARRWPPITHGGSLIATAGRRSSSRGRWARKAAARPSPSAR